MPLQNDDLTLIHYAIILPLVKRSFEENLQQVPEMFRVHEPYIELIDEALSLLHLDLRQLKKEQHSRNLRIYRIDSDETFSSYGYVCGRYEGQNRYVNANLKRQTSECMSLYLHGKRVEDLMTSH
ncbi:MULTISPECIES: hypothetical protein [Geomicrobium]|uniref:Uncharacterized protein n=1 Tax=Geomicrobium sediminis TaxID=1347788 RepID=A0ABS2P851_9BACL|nr:MULTISPECIES: hypothetical protein [Geomicrobium]MBM7631595.1 hypothetical protein [Geomicrobium sediminis]GAK09354.1 hypothetical protein JCM19038_3184 [Geomicrobium sp. JCM 19038]